MTEPTPTKTPDPALVKLREMLTPYRPMLVAFAPQLPARIAEKLAALVEEIDRDE